MKTFLEYRSVTMSNRYESHFRLEGVLLHLRKTQGLTGRFLLH